MAPLRKFGPPVVDQIGPMPYLAVQTMFDPAFPPGRYNYWKSNLARELTDDLIDAVVERAVRAPLPHSAVMLEHYHGAYARPQPADTAYSHRQATYDVVIIGSWTDPKDTDANVAWARDLFQAVLPKAAGGVYVNFLDGDEGADRVRAAYGQNYGRLAALKKTWDPANVFRMNQNVNPA